MKKSVLKKIAGMNGLLGWLIAGILSIIISSFFVLIYNYSGTHIANPSGSTDYKWQAGQYKATWGEGINYMRMDENGFNNLSSDTYNIDILLMGGSHMEATQFGTAYNAGSLLNEYLNDHKTYNIGMSGHQLMNCLDNLQAALDEYAPSEYVVIQTSSLAASADDIRAVYDGTFEEIPSYDTGIIYQLQRIPVLKVIYKQLTDKLAIDRASQKPDDIEGEADGAVNNGTDTQEKSELMAKLLNAKAGVCAEKDVAIILVYTPPVEVSESGELKRSDDEKWVEAVKGIAEDSGIIFIDCYEAFKSEFDASYALPFGFHNSTMGSGHLNKTGHRIVARQVADVVKEGRV